MPTARTLSPKQRSLAGDLAMQAPLFRLQLFQAGLYQTAHLMDQVVKTIGWEIADLDIAAKKTAKTDKR